MVSVPMPGPTSSTVSTGATSASATIFCRMASFTRKFCPSEYFAVRPWASSTARVAEALASGDSLPTALAALLRAAGLFAGALLVGALLAGGWLAGALLARSLLGALRALRSGAGGVLLAAGGVLRRREDLPSGERRSAGRDGASDTEAGA